MLLARNNKRRGGQMVETYAAGPDDLAELRGEIASLQANIGRKEAELADLYKKARGLAYDYRLAVGYSGASSSKAQGLEAGVEASQKVILQLTDELQGLRSDLALAEKRLISDQRSHDRRQTEQGEPEIRAALGELLPAIEQAGQLTQEYMALRRKYKYIPQAWPFPPNIRMDDTREVEGWVNTARKFLEKR